MNRGIAKDDPPVAVICGGGTLPLAVLEGACRAGRKVLVIGIEGEAGPELDGFSPIRLGWGQIGKLFNTLGAAGCREVVLIGSVSRRPDFRSIVGDLGTMRRLPRILSALIGGDDSLLVKVIRLFEEDGFEVIGAQDLAPDLVSTAGAMVGQTPEGDARRDLEIAERAAAELGRLDIGQAAVAVGGRVVALEAAEGTDAMLERCIELRRIGRIRAKGRAGVLVKRAKPGQDLRVDLPTIGPLTIERAAAAGLAGVAVEAGRVLIADRPETVARAEQSGLFLWGMSPSD